jgi:SAM-dependent methyltransferase
MTNPSHWVQRHARSIPDGEVLDLACGSGRHARLLATLGHPVLALDRDPAALAQAAGPGIVTLQADVEQADRKQADGSATWPFEAGRFAGIVVTNYLHRPLMPDLLASLAPHGVLIYETFALGNAEFGKPSNPNFLLQPGELLDWATGHGLRIVAFEEGLVQAPKTAMVQRLCCAKPEFPRASAFLGPF